MLSRRKSTSDKSIQDEVHLEAKDTSIITGKKTHITTASLENCQLIESCEMKTEEKSLKEIGRKSTSSKSIQDEVEAKGTSILMEKMTHSTATSLESCQINKSCDMKIEEKGWKEAGRKTTSDRSIQDKVQLMTKDTLVSMEKITHTAATSLESGQANENYEMKTEQKGWKETGRKSTSDELIQGAVHLKTKDTSVSMEKITHATAISLEDSQANESCELKAEKNKLKEIEKSEKMQLQDENLVTLTRAHSKPKIIETKSIEIKMEKAKMKDKTKNTEIKIEKANMEDISKNIEVKMEDKGLNILSDTLLKQTNEPEFKMTPIATKVDSQKPSNVAVPRKCPPLSTPLLSERPLVLTTHLVPSLPIGLFEVLVEAIEVATEKPVVLLYEPRSYRPVAKDVADIAILPASTKWENGELLPVSFCFEHHFNKSNSPCIYADVIVATDRAPHVQDITDLRGHRCSLPDRKRKIGATALLFNYLYAKGESPAFFGNTLDADTQLDTLQMVAGKQAEIGILESPVIKCHKNTLSGIDSLHILTSLGPLPPYRIMIKKTFPDILTRKITAYLLKLNQDRDWIDRFATFGVTGFAKNFEKLYELGDVKSAVTSVPYY